KSAEIDATSVVQIAHARVTIGGLLGSGDIGLEGLGGWQTGGVDLVQTAGVKINAGGCSFYMTEIFTLSCHGAVAMNVTVAGVGWIGTEDYNVHASVYGNLAVSVDGHGNVTYAGAASAYVGITIGGTSHDTPLTGFKFANDGFSIDIFGHSAR